jgi:hypothetical protein
MVTIVDFVKRQNREGKEFNALILQSGIELVKAKETGEVLLLNHRWVYLKEGETIEEKVIADSKVAMPV